MHKEISEAIAAAVKSRIADAKERAKVQAQERFGLDSEHFELLWTTFLDWWGANLRNDAASEIGASNDAGKPGSAGVDHQGIQGPSRAHVLKCSHESSQRDY
jgi:hypothetical protein